MGTEGDALLAFFDCCCFAKRGMGESVPVALRFFGGLCIPLLSFSLLSLYSAFCLKGIEFIVVSRHHTLLDNSYNISACGLVLSDEVK